MPGTARRPIVSSVTVSLKSAVPTLRIFDLGRAKRFYVDYLGCTVDWDGDSVSDGPVYLQVARGPLVLHLSSHHDDGTPGTVVLVEMEGTTSCTPSWARGTTRSSTPASSPAREATSAWS